RRLRRWGAPPAPAEPLADFLVAEGAPAVVRETEGVAPDRVVVEAHVPASAHTRVAAALAGYLAGTGDVAIESAPLADVDWEGVFRRHHRPVLVGRRLAIAPPWDVPDGGGREVIVIEPGQAFGTGQHATTRMCLEAIEAEVTGGRVAAALAAVTAEEGHLVMSGLLDTQVETVTAAFPAWRTVGVRAEDRWRTLTLARAA